MLFQNRTAAGKVLAQKLTDYANCPDVVVLALPRGGVPVAFEVAQALKVPLDLVIVRKLGVPKNEELAMGALAHIPGTRGSADTVRILNQSIVNQGKISESEISKVALREQIELERRERIYRGDRHIPFPDLRGKTIILVDDGLATGATMWAATMVVKQQQPKQIIIAVPVAAPETCEELQTKVDKIVCVATPSPFCSVGLWYGEFPQTTDEEVCDLLNKANNHQQSLVFGK